MEAVSLVRPLVIEHNEFYSPFISVENKVDRFPSQLSQML